MHIQVNGKHIDVGEALTGTVEDRLTETVKKYAEKPVDAVVTFSKDRYEFVSDITVHLSTGLTSKSQGKASDIYECFEKSLEKMEKQLRRYKRRLKNHHNERATPIEVTTAPYYVMEAGPEDEAEEPGTLQPVIVAEMQTPVKSLSVGEAVMQMELDGARMLVFRNNAHGGVNVVYQRDDGNIGWIDPRSMG